MNILKERWRKQRELAKRYDVYGLYKKQQQQQQQNFKDKTSSKAPVIQLELEQQQQRQRQQKSSPFSVENNLFDEIEKRNRKESKKEKKRKDKEKLKKKEKRLLEPIKQDPNNVSKSSTTSVDNNEYSTTIVNDT